MVSTLLPDRRLGNLPSNNHWFFQLASQLHHQSVVDESGFWQGVRINDIAVSDLSIELVRNTQKLENLWVRRFISNGIKRLSW